VRVRFVLVGGDASLARRDTGSDKYSCRAEIKEVVLTGYK